MQLAFSDKIDVSVVIPSWDGDRGGNVPLLIDDLKKQSFQDMEVTVVVGVAPQGKAINQGVAQSKGKTLIILDDDSRIADPETFAKLLGVLEKSPSIGMVGASIVQPLDASAYQRRLAAQMPRFSMPVVDRVTESDMPCHGCCAFPRSVFEKVGGEREGLLRGLDPDLRQRIRNAGYRIVLAPQAVVSHPVPKTFMATMRMFWRNGLGSAYAQVHHPDLVYDTDESTEWKGKKLRVPFIRRVLRFPIRFVQLIMKRWFIRALGEMVYAVGFAWGSIAYRLRRAT